MILPKPIKLAHATLKVISRLSLLSDMSDIAIIVIRIYFIIDNQIAFIAGKRDLSSYRKSFIS